VAHIRMSHESLACQSPCTGAPARSLWCFAARISALPSGGGVFCSMVAFSGKRGTQPSAAGSNTTGMRSRSFTGFEIDWNKVIFKMLNLKGIYGREMFETWYKMIALVRGGLDLSPLVTHRLPTR
jgi:threonine dehydrogenase-like Zn-dependent dehydrogenase